MFRYASRIALRLPDAPDAPPLDAHEAALQAATAGDPQVQSLTGALVRGYRSAGQRAISSASPALVKALE